MIHPLLLHFLAYESHQSVFLNDIHRGSIVTLITSAVQYILYYRAQYNGRTSAIFRACAGDDRQHVTSDCQNGRSKTCKYLVVVLAMNLASLKRKAGT